MISLNKTNFYTEFSNNLKLDNGDIVYLVSDLTNLFVKFKKMNLKFDINKLIDSILNKIDSNGTLLIPTFNWDYCKGIDFHYLHTKSMTGVLGKTALLRKDFDRTNNPIYSFAVTGKYKNYLLKFKNEDCFGNKSPFDFLYKKNAKYVSIDINFRDYGFTPIHYAEQKANASYRFIKTFEGY